MEILALVILTSKNRHLLVQEPAVDKADHLPYIIVPENNCEPHTYVGHVKAELSRRYGMLACNVQLLPWSFVYCPHGKSELTVRVAAVTDWEAHSTGMEAFFAADYPSVYRWERTVTGAAYTQKDHMRRLCQMAFEDVEYFETLGAEKSQGG